jgi:hypothetical protein
MDTGAARTALAWLGHPLTVLALVVLIVNDHVLKAAHPGLLTGKLSDVAGLVLAPPLVAGVVALLVPRVPARPLAVSALVFVGVGFTATKCSGYGAQVASAAWSLVHDPSLIRADPTDLLTLPALALAWWSWTCARGQSLPARWVRAIRVAVLLPVALIGVAATSPLKEPAAVQAVSVDGRIHLAGDDIGDGGGSGASWSSSTDDGLTWSQVAYEDADRLGRRYRQPVTQACSAAAPRTCYRVVARHLAVERSDDGGSTWADSWMISDRRRGALARAYPGLGDADRELASVAVAVHDLDGGGHLVLVANGRDGFALRHADGTWQRIGFPKMVGPGAADLPAVPSLGSVNAGDRGSDLFMSIVLVLVLGFTTVTVGAARMLHRTEHRPVWWLLVAHQPITVPLLLALLAGQNDEIVLAMLRLVVAGAATLVTFATAVFGTVFVVKRGRTRPRWAAQVVLGGALTLVLSGLVLRGWFSGLPPSTALAVTLAVLAAVPGIVWCLRAARLIRPQIPAPPGLAARPQVTAPPGPPSRPGAPPLGPSR